MNITHNDASTLMRALYNRVSGAQFDEHVNGSFVSVAEATLSYGYNKIVEGLSEVLSKTVFSVRPYNRKFPELFLDSQRWGFATRKMQVIDKPVEADQRYLVKDGESIDQFKVNKPQVLETKFYGSAVYQRSITLFKDQLDTAFSGEAEFAQFVAMVLQNVSDLIEQDHEMCAREAVGNFIGAIITQAKDDKFVYRDEYNNPGYRIVYLWSDFCSEKDIDETAESIENHADEFWKYAFARIKTISDNMTERSYLYHTNIDGKPVTRHTPKDRQRLYLHNEYLNKINASVLSSVFNPDYMKLSEHTAVNYWNSITEPRSVVVDAVNMLDAQTGGVVSYTPDGGLMFENVLGVLFDENAIGVTTVNAWSAASPFNAAGGYTNTYWHFTDRYFNDFTENGVVFLLE